MTTPTETAPGAGVDTAKPAESALTTREGKITIDDSVVTKIAGLAAREVSGVHSMGSSTSRAFGAIRQRIPGSSTPAVTQGVSVEVGETEAAIDLDLIVEYGVSVADLGHAVQRNVKSSVERMTGLKVVEVNVNVDDVYLGDLQSDDDTPPAPPRVS